MSNVYQLLLSLILSSLQRPSEFLSHQGLLELNPTLYFNYLLTILSFRSMTQMLSSSPMLSVM